jgi:hypothetical protein
MGGQSCGDHPRDLLRNEGAATAGPSAGALELVCHCRERHARGPQLASPAEGCLLLGNLDQVGAVVGEPVAVRSAATGKLPFGPLVLHGNGRSLSDRLALPLADRCEQVQHHPPGGGASVDLAVHAKQRALAVSKVGVHEIAEIANGAREAIELHDQQSLGRARLERSQSSGQSRPLKRLRAGAAVNDDLGNLEVVNLGVCLDLLALRLQRDAVVRPACRLRPGDTLSFSLPSPIRVPETKCITIGSSGTQGSHSAPGRGEDLSSRGCL